MSSKFLSGFGRFILGMFCFVFLVVGCQYQTPQTQTQTQNPTHTVPIPTQASTMTITPGLVKTSVSTEVFEDLSFFVNNEKITVNNIQYLSEYSETVGKILNLNITNSSIENINSQLSCGTLLLAEDGVSQSFVVVQPSQIIVDPGQIYVTQLFTICADPDKAIPSYQSVYKLGGTADGKMGQFSKCLCGLDLSNVEEEKFTGLQFAFWMNARGGILTN
jgi:hypothetical protein